VHAHVNAVVSPQDHRIRLRTVTHRVLRNERNADEWRSDRGTEFVGVALSVSIGDGASAPVHKHRNANGSANGSANGN
jgi:hypothetical protein